MATEILPKTLMNAVHHVIRDDRKNHRLPGQYQLRLGTALYDDLMRTLNGPDFSISEFTGELAVRWGKVSLAPDPALPDDFALFVIRH